MANAKLIHSSAVSIKSHIAKRLITRALLWCGLIVILLLGCWQGITAYSKFALSLTDLLSLLMQHNNQASLAAQLLIEIRLPRVLLAIIVGANLAVAGLLMQVMTRNSLASPAVLGINAGAACVVALSSIGLGFTFLTSTFLQAMVGAVLSCALVVGLTRAALITTDEQAYGVLYWLAGSIANTRWESIPMLAAISLLTLGYGWWLSPKLNVLVLGDEVASSLGINLRALQWSCGALITILTAVSVAVAGPIAFVGLIIPHVAKRLLKQVSNMAYEQLLPLSMLLGSILMVWADVLSRAVAYPAETPVGLLTALIGTPVFIALACRRRLDS